MSKSDSICLERCYFFADNCRQKEDGTWDTSEPDIPTRTSRWTVPTVSRFAPALAASTSAACCWADWHPIAARGIKSPIRSQARRVISSVLGLRLFHLNGRVASASRQSWPVPEYSGRGTVPSVPLPHYTDSCEPPGVYLMALSTRLSTLRYKFTSSALIR